MSFLTGKASKSTSGNTNNGLLTSDLGGQISQGGAANNFLGAALGTDTNPTDVAGEQAGYNNYLQTAGYAPAMKQLSQNLTGQGAAAGLLNSGSTTKALANYGGQLNNQYANNYLQLLQGQQSAGTAAAGVVEGAGQTSTSTGASPGILGSAGSVLGGLGSIGQAGGFAAIFSDRRLKQNIQLVRREADGLGWYDFRYTFAPTMPQRGVMADEVRELRPWALGPQVQGYDTVNYGAL